MGPIIETSIYCVNEAKRIEAEDAKVEEGAIMSHTEYARMVYYAILRLAAVSNSVQFVIRRFDLFEVYGLLP